MKPKTKDYKLKSNANYESKIKRKQLILRPQDKQLIAAIEADNNKLNPLVRKLLCEHYGIINIE